MMRHDQVALTFYRLIDHLFRHVKTKQYASRYLIDIANLQSRVIKTLLKR